jgi:hypothetical protein
MPARRTGVRGDAPVVRRERREPLLDGFRDLRRRKV